MVVRAQGSRDVGQRPCDFILFTFFGVGIGSQDWGMDMVGYGQAWLGGVYLDGKDGYGKEAYAWFA